MFTGSQLQLLRQSCGLMQKELAFKMNIAQQRVSALENMEREISEKAANKALKAMQLTKGQALKFLKNTPSGKSGGGGY